MPMIWRVLFTVEEILKEEGLDFGVEELSYLYTITTFGSSRFILKSKPQKEIPILKVTHTDPLWKNQFFFVRRDSIPGGDSLPSHWISDDFNKCGDKKEAAKRGEAFLKLDPVIRTFKVRIPDPSGDNTGASSSNMSSIQKSASKSSAPKFSLDDIDSSIPTKPIKVEPSPAPRAVTTRGKAAAAAGKRKRSSEAEQDESVVEAYLHEAATEAVGRLHRFYAKKIKDLETTVSDCRASLAKKDKEYFSMLKEKKAKEQRLYELEREMTSKISEATAEAKRSATLAVLQARVKMVKEARDPTFDQSSWALEKWEAAIDVLNEEANPRADASQPEEQVETSPGKADVEAAAEEAVVDAAVEAAVKVGDEDAVKV